jgi:hypothetical protein
MMYRILSTVLDHDVQLAYMDPTEKRIMMYIIPSWILERTG